MYIFSQTLVPVCLPWKFLNLRESPFLSLPPVRFPVRQCFRRRTVSKSLRRLHFRGLQVYQFRLLFSIFISLLMFIWLSVSVNELDSNGLSTSHLPNKANFSLPRTFDFLGLISPNFFVKTSLRFCLDFLLFSIPCVLDSCLDS